MSLQKSTLNRSQLGLKSSFYVFYLFNLFCFIAFKLAFLLCYCNQCLLKCRRVLQGQCLKRTAWPSLGERYVAAAPVVFLVDPCPSGLFSCHWDECSQLISWAIMKPWGNGESSTAHMDDLPSGRLSRQSMPHPNLASLAPPLSDFHEGLAPTVFPSYKE